MTKIIIAFHNFANAPTNYYLILPLIAGLTNMRTSRKVFEALSQLNTFSNAIYQT